MPAHFTPGNKAKWAERAQANGVHSALGEIFGLFWGLVDGVDVGPVWA